MVPLRLALGPVALPLALAQGMAALAQGMAAPKLGGCWGRPLQG